MILLLNFLKKEMELELDEQNLWLPFQIFQESYSKNEIVDGQFIIDNTLGKDVKFTIDVLGDETVKNLTIYNSNNIVLFNLTNEKISNYYVKEFPILQVRIFTIFFCFIIWRIRLWNECLKYYFKNTYYIFYPYFYSQTHIHL